MRISKKVFIFVTSLVICTVAFCPGVVFAAASVSVSSGTWAIGTKAALTATTSSSYTVTNDNSGGTEDITISVGGSASWTPSATPSPGNSQFVLQLTNSGGTVITGTPSALTSGLANNGTYPLTLYFTTPTADSSGEGSQQSITVTLTATNWVFSCGNNLVVAHIAGVVAPVTKTVTYGTVTSSLSGASKCWITQNLGATNQATSATDGSEDSAGWYWQFNRMQGFKHDGTTRTPGTAWIGSIDEAIDWTSANDPCTIELGTGWRIPTYTEWTNVGANGAWNNYNDTYASDLKLHTPGYLNNSTGALWDRGSGGLYSSSTRYSNTDAWDLDFYSSNGMHNHGKVYGFSVRCLKD